MTTIEITHWNGAVALLGALGLSLATGCGEPQQEPPAVSAADVREEVTEAVDTAEAYARERQSRLAARATRAAGELGRAIDAAREEAEEVPDDVAETLETAIARAQRARETIGRELDALKDAGAEEVRSADRRLSDALDEAAEARREIASALEGEEG